MPDCFLGLCVGYALRKPSRQESDDLNLGQARPPSTQSLPLRNLNHIFLLYSMAEGTNTMLTLWFAMLGHSVNVDSVEVSSNANVASLRSLLKVKCENTFRKTDSFDIKLWQVGTFSVCSYVAAHLSA